MHSNFTACPQTPCNSNTMAHAYRRPQAKWNGFDIEHSCVKVNVDVNALRGSTGTKVPCTLKDKYNSQLKPRKVWVQLTDDVAALLQRYDALTPTEAFQVERGVWDALEGRTLQTTVWSTPPTTLEYCPAGELLVSNPNGFCLPTGSNLAEVEALCEQSRAVQRDEGEILGDGMRCVIPVHLPALADMVQRGDDAAVLEYVTARMPDSERMQEGDVLDMHPVLRAVLRGWNLHDGDSMFGSEWSVLGVSQWETGGDFKLECFGGKRHMGEGTLQGAIRETREESLLHFEAVRVWRTVAVNNAPAVVSVPE